MNVKLSVTTSAAFVLLLFGSQASGQRLNQTVQLPIVRQFNVRNSASVPDGGTIGLGGVTRSSTGSVSRGVPGTIGRPFSNRAGGRLTSSGNASVSVWILSKEEIEKGILAGAKTLPKEPAVPYYKQVWGKQALNRQGQQAVQSKPLKLAPVVGDGRQTGNAEPEGIFLSNP